MDLHGKVALVTGAAHGIGLATAEQLLKNGVKGVAICDIDYKKGEDAAASVIKEYGKDRVIFIKTDVTKSNDLKEAFKETEETFGTIDIVVNNAGIIDDDHWETEVEINAKGVVRGTELALKYMGKDRGGKGGAVVNVASVAGLGKNSACPVYDGTKSFVVGYSRSISFPPLYKSHGVRILCMCPGFTDTPIAAGVLDAYEKLNFDKQKILSNVTMQQPDHVAEGIVHILREGEPGTVWVSDRCEPVYQVNFPELVKP
ncbi:15-hydroxyprostaglandin dehydrogenase [NAD(+)]-like [Zootermopsis nevadensis]|uniref:15-hydroxyprostaglandin dehydrogenase [NAD(+)]-like n=1 Tax=Zootermopsis nevadensis TaxID=136037 RepID=UPI000B8EC949|nr:15-hydroxyprostaglandin dehydrogenase [NAD(+)]-like [Zootermopsis nevadensis]XP_021928551.1 15-hydroxyprostaglandin dehydrogenase [NAD(+)]-like [Zootermopsis nevadensis]